MKKLKLNELKVKSFVTDMDNANVQTIKGGAVGGTVGVICEIIERPDTEAPSCVIRYTEGCSPSEAGRCE